MEAFGFDLVSRDPGDNPKLHQVMIERTYRLTREVWIARHG